MREKGKQGGGGGSAGRGLLEGVLEVVLALEGSAGRVRWKEVLALVRVPAGVLTKGSSAERGSSKGFQQVFQRSHLSRLSQKPWKRQLPHLWGAYHSSSHTRPSWGRPEQSGGTTYRPSCDTF